MFSGTDQQENKLFAEIRRLGQDLDEFKNRQFAGGDNIRVQLNTTSDTWDVDETVPSTAGMTWWEIVFVPDDDYLGFTQLGFNYLVTTASGYEVFSSYPSPTYTGPYIAYIVEFANPNLVDVNVKLKFSLRSFSTGTLSWSIVRQGP